MRPGRTVPRAHPAGRRRSPDHPELAHSGSGMPVHKRDRYPSAVTFRFPGETAGANVLSIRPFRRLWIATSLSSLGDWLSLLALTAEAAILAKRGVAAAGAAVSGVWLTSLLPALLLGQDRRFRGQREQAEPVPQARQRRGDPQAPEGPDGQHAGASCLSGGSEGHGARVPITDFACGLPGPDCPPCPDLANCRGSSTGRSGGRAAPGGVSGAPCPYRPGG